MSPNLSIRPFDSTDSGPTGDRAAFDSMARETVAAGDVFPFESVAGVEAYWFGAQSHVWVAEEGGDVLGTYTIHPNVVDRGAHVANAGYMVSTRARGRGIGRALGEHSLASARALGFRAMQYNYVVASNTGAVKLWRAIGFDVLATVPGAFRHPRNGFTDVHVMFRTLEP